MRRQCCRMMLEPLEARDCPSAPSTPYDTFPDFGADPTDVAVASGPWWQDATWGAGGPSADSVVSIPAGITVTYDAPDGAAWTVEILAGGTLTWDTSPGTHELTVVNLIVRESDGTQGPGTLEIGTSDNPLPADS